MIVSRTPKDIEEMLMDYSFLRGHRSYLVNLNEILKYIKGDGGYFQIRNDTTVDVSKSRKAMLLTKLQSRRN